MNRSTLFSVFALAALLGACGVTPVDEDMKRNDDLFPARIARPRTPTSLVPDHAVSGEAVRNHALYPIPLNGDFELYAKGHGYTPDNWSVSSGTWGTEFEAYTSDQASKEKSLHIIPVAGAAVLESDLFDVKEDTNYILSWRFKVLATGNTIADVAVVGIDLYGSDDTYLGGDSYTIDAASYFGATPTGWLRRAVRFNAIAGARKAKISITKGTSADISILVDAVEYLEDLKQPEWTTPVFENGWSNYDTVNWNAAGYLVDSMGFVHLRGLVAGGTVAPNTAIFTLPAIYSPAKGEIFAVVSNNALGRCTVLPDGKVVAETGSNVWFSLDGIVFQIEQ